MALLRALAVAALAGGALASEPLADGQVQAEFEQFKLRHRRAYADAKEEAQRLGHFRTSLERVRAHNEESGRTFEMSVNQFADMSDEEFSRKVLMSPQKCSATHGPGKAVRAPPAADLPTRIDWRERGVVSEVKNQGHCGSCWTFSTTGCLEAHLAIKYDAWHAPRLSEQQLVDCAQAFDNHGCNGGLPSHAFEYLRHAGGLETEFHYPYQGKDGKCLANLTGQRVGPFEPMSAGVGVQVPGGSVNLTVGDEQSLKYYLATHGPVSIAFQVASDFRYYGRGVYTSTVCKNGAMDVNHAVLAVGYGVDPETKLQYWLVKNSWDYSWGDEGFFKIESFKNMCGVADCMAFPDLYGLNTAAAEAAEEATPILV